MRAAGALVIAAALVSGACSTSSTAVDTPQAGEVTIFAASSLVDAFARIGDELKKADPGVRLIFNFGSSSTLATQIANGAPADALSERIMGEVFRISAFRAEYRREAVIVPWAEI